MLEHVKYNTFENDKMELFNNFKKNDIPKEKKPFKISILFKLNTCMVTRGRKLNFDVPRWINLLCMTV